MRSKRVIKMYSYKNEVSHTHYFYNGIKFVNKIHMLKKDDGYYIIFKHACPDGESILLHTSDKKQAMEFFKEKMNDFLKSWSAPYDL